MKHLILLCLLICAAPVMTQGNPAPVRPQARSTPADEARAASVRLEKATTLLDNAKTARNRVKALSAAIHAYEDGLQAMREGLRRAAIREATLIAELNSREEELANLLGVLQSVERTPTPALLVHPAGPMGTARSGMILADVTPALNQRAEHLRRTLQEVSILRSLQQTAANTLADGLRNAQTARSELSRAISDRTNLPQRFTEDPIQTALLIASTETLESFASGLSTIAVDEVPGSLPDITDRKGQLPLPVQGQILRSPNEADAAGVQRPGLIMATRPHALVTTPAAATIRYRGPLLNYGNVVILEPQSGILLVLAGLDQVYGNTGEVLPGGSPVGLMGGDDTQTDALLIENDQGAGTAQPETLYIELRQDNVPVDPTLWFSTE
ncbi:murein hydrolase activator EnvC [Roseovarius sp. EL26]|uniref:murein hydrolase activator EnvC family protein n=1 Tax=Roseovarius sp. EL26 TaxID=2126672 RepID=UPI000EA27941|nr:peptidoglycan DD-metalloendopeptidase family protein [Roseovarius sp. EL26]